MDAFKQFLDSTVCQGLTSPNIPHYVICSHVTNIFIYCLSLRRFSFRLLILFNFRTNWIQMIWSPKIYFISLIFWVQKEKYYSKILSCFLSYFIRSILFYMHVCVWIENYIFLNCFSIARRYFVNPQTKLYT